MRPLLRADCGEAAGLIRRAFAATPIPLQPPPSALAVTDADVLAHLDGGGGGVVEPDRACLLWMRQGDALHLSRLAVVPSARRRGLAFAMLEAAEREAGSAGAARLTLSTRLALVGNHRLFLRFGFIEGERSAHAGFTSPTTVAFAKPIGEAPVMDRRA